MALPPDSLYARAFAADSSTWRALRDGLAGRKARIQRGRLAVALRTLASEPAPKLLFVDLDGVKEPEVAGRDLAAVCAFETAVVAIGSEDTAQFTRSLFRFGIADYLVKPITPALVREACTTLTDDLPDRSYAGRVIAFAGSAGSGTATLVAEAARSIAGEGRTVSVVDLEPVSGRLAPLLGVEPADGLSALLDALGSETAGDGHGPIVTPEQVDTVCALADTGLSLIAYAPGAALPPTPSPAAVQTLLEHLANRTHLVLVTGFPDSEVQFEIVQGADSRVLIYEPTLSSLSAAVRTLALLGAKNPATLVQCSSRKAGSALSAAHIRFATADRPPDVVVPFDSALHAAAIGSKSGRPGKAYRNAVRQAMGHAIDNAPLPPADGG